MEFLWPSITTLWTWKSFPRWRQLEWWSRTMELAPRSWVFKFHTDSVPMWSNPRPTSPPHLRLSFLLNRWLGSVWKGLRATTTQRTVANRMETGTKMIQSSSFASVILGTNKTEKAAQVGFLLLCILFIPMFDWNNKFGKFGVFHFFLKKSKFSTSPQYTQFIGSMNNF